MFVHVWAGAEASGCKTLDVIQVVVFGCLFVVAFERVVVLLLVVLLISLSSGLSSSWALSAFLWLLLTLMLSLS